MTEEERSTLFTIEFKRDEQGNLVMDKFHAYNGFMNLPMNIQHELINETMKQLGERPAFAGGMKISLN